MLILSLGNGMSWGWTIGLLLAGVLIGEVPAMLASIVSSARTGVLVVGRGFSDVRALGRGEMARVCTLPLYLVGRQIHTLHPSI